MPTKLAFAQILKNFIRKNWLIIIFFTPLFILIGIKLDIYAVCTGPLYFDLLSLNFDSTFECLIIAAGTAFITFIMGMILIMVFAVSWGLTNSIDNKYLKYIIFIIWLIIITFFVDLWISKGVFLLDPSITFLTSGTFEGSYWNCEDWVSVEEVDYDGNLINHSWCDGY